MTNSYLLEVIRVFDPLEYKEIILFLESPYYNRSKKKKDILLLFKIIIKSAPEFSDLSLEKGRIYKQVFPGDSMETQKLEKLMVELNKLLRLYVLTNRCLQEENETKKQLDWSAWLRERGLSERSQQIIAKLKSQEIEAKNESMNKYRSLVMIAEEAHEWECTYNQVKGDLNIPSLIFHLDTYYFNYRVELQNRYLIQQKATNLPDPNFFKTGYIDYYKEQSILLDISTKIFNILRKSQPTVQETLDLMYLLQEKEDALSFQALDHFYAYLRNFCTLLINGGNEEFVLVIHEINKDNLKRGFFMLNGKMPPNAYLNLMLAATRSKDFQWAKEFTENYKDSINGGDPDQFFYRFNISHCLFAEGRFEEALDYLPDAPSNIHYHHMLRILELKIYYELQSELLLYKLDAFRKYIERTAPKVISNNYREMDVNFLNLLLQLIQSQAKGKDRATRMIERIESKSPVADRAWLLQKARELK